MKFSLAIFVYVLMGVVLGWGILLLFIGKPWLLVVAFLAYLIGLAKIGCLSH